MLETKQLKMLGIRFGKSFQTAVRTAGMFTADHQSVQRPLEQSFNLLNDLMKQTGALTIGFVDNQVLINSVLTNEPGLAILEKEFLKRGIAAVTFEPGLTLARFRRIVTVLSAPAATIEAAGGIREYLEVNEMPGARIVTASRNQKKNEQGDTLIESDSEAYILSRQMAEDSPRDFMESLDTLLESACVDPAARSATLQSFSVGNPNIAGEGYGVPVPVPNLVIDHDSAPGTGWDQAPAHASANGEPLASGTVGGDSFVGLAAGPGVGGGVGFGAGGGSTEPAGPYVVSQPANKGDGQSSSGVSKGYRSFMELVEDSVSRSLVEDKGNPRKSYLALAQILKDSKLDTVLSFFPEDRREQLRTLPAEQLAAEYVEESTLKLIAKQLQVSEGKKDKYIIEEDVLRLLARSLQATHMAERLAFKLAKFFQDYSIPLHMQQKVQEELRWSTLGHKQKFTRLMEQPHYDLTGFRRLMDHIEELMRQREPEKVLQLTLHYFAFLDDETAQIGAEDLSRSIELIRTAKLGREPETATIIGRLGKLLLRTEPSQMTHFQAANNLATLSQSASIFEAFDKVVTVAEALQKSNVRDPEAHKRCCGTGLTRMLAHTSIDRIIELYIANRNDSHLAKTAATILRATHPTGADAVLKCLTDEKNATTRLALLRLVTHIGPSALDIARKYLKDERWYVVRNMCNILTELRDPELSDHIGDLLRHSEPRVQQAAFNALVKTRSLARAAMFSLTLTEMAPVILEPALDELLYLRANESVYGLEQFICSERTAPVMVRKGLLVLAAVPGPDSMAALNRCAVNPQLSDSLRNAAAQLAAKHSSAMPASASTPTEKPVTIH